jgi:hypothetical protein
MSLSMSQTALHSFEIGLDALSVLLDKAEAFAAEKKIDTAVLLNWRLAPDMYPLTRQIQIVTDMAKNGASRLADVTPPRYEDTETTIAELKARIAKASAHLKTLDAKAIDGAAAREIVFPLGPVKKGQMTGADYLIHFILPNFYFHLTAAYAILRACGVELGKAEYMGKIPLTMS